MVMTWGGGGASSIGVDRKILLLTMGALVIIGGKKDPSALILRWPNKAYARRIQS